MTDEEYNLFIVYCQTGKHPDLKAADYQVRRQTTRRQRNKITDYFLQRDEKN
jgi:hypothetical protein